MDFKLDENTLWILGLLALVFFLFPQKNTKTAVEKVDEKVEEKKEYEYIYKRKAKERRRLVY